MKPPLLRLCRTGQICAGCREPGPAGDAFRASLAIAYRPPEAWPACPYDDGRAVPEKMPLACARCDGDHPTADCPIPPDTSPELERREAKAGGCCGAPPPAPAPGDE